MKNNPRQQASLDLLRKTMAKKDNLHDTLIRYEGAVSRVERDGDDSDEAVEELRVAREALMVILRRAV